MNDDSPGGLLEEIERIRAEMYQTAEGQDSPNATSVREVSVELDNLISRFMSAPKRHFNQSASD